MMSLYNDIFFYFDNDIKGFKFGETIKKKYEEIGCSHLRSITHKVITSSSKRKSQFLFVGTKYRQLIRAAASNGVVVVGDAKQKILSVAFGAAFYGDHSQISELIQIYNEKNEQRLENLINICCEQLKNWEVKVIVVVNDSLPLERLWVQAARNIGVDSICIQHGLFSCAGASINDGKYVDTMCVYDGYQADILRYSGARNVEIFGYYQDIKRYGFSEKRDVVCIIGQPWVDYYHDKADIYVDLIKRLIKLLKDNGIEWVYKPHPSEKSAQKYLPDGKKRLYSSSLHESFGEYDIFISPASTALLEATMAGKLAIQIYDERLCEEKFNIFGYAHTVSLATDENELITLVKKCMPIANDVLSTNISRRFQALVNQVLSH